MERCGGLVGEAVVLDCGTVGLFFWIKRTEEQRLRERTTCFGRVTLLFMSLRMKSLTKDTSNVPWQLLNSRSEGIRTTSELIDTPSTPDASPDCEEHQYKLDWPFLHEVSSPSPTL
jgi:hypothetical protein